MNTKNKSIASQALLEMDDITKTLQTESKKTLSAMLSEAVKNAIREGCDDENDDEDDDYEVIDNESEKSTDKKKKAPKKQKDEDTGQEEIGQENGGEMQQNMQQPANANPQLGGNQNPANARPNMGQNVGMNQSEDTPQDMSGEEMSQGDGEDESWNEFSDYQVGDGNTYDLTGENDYDKVVKVYKLLKDDDQVVVTNDGNTLHLKDDNAGTEYVIDLGGDDDEESAPEEMESEDDELSALNEAFGDDEMAGFPEFGDDDMDFEENDNEFGDEGFDFDEEGDEFEDDYNNFGDEYDDSLDDIGNESGEFEDDSFELDDNEPLFEVTFNNKNKKKPMKENKKSQVLFEVDLGYTDNYQDKDPIAGLSNEEPSKGKKSWHKGVPTGTSKPWAGDSKSKGDPFKKTQKVQGSVNEEDIPTDGSMMGDLEEANLSQSRWNDTHANGNRIPAANGDEYRRKGMQKTHKGNEYRPTSTNESKDLMAIKKENKELKKAIVELRKSLNEACVTNVNLGKITKLFLENATSQKEKIEIVNRFANEAKTVEQSKMLYESIDRELKKSNKQSLNLNESSITANGTKKLNEGSIYKSKDLMETIDLIRRVDEI